MTKKQIFVNLIVFVLCFSSALVMFGAYWVVKSFGATDFAQILFHLRFPLLDSSTPLVGSFIAKVLLPSFAVATLVAFTQPCVKIGVKFAKFFYGFVLSNNAKIVKITFAVALFALFLNITNNKLKITRYLNAPYSTLYEEQYAHFDKQALANFTPKQNLIVIFAESLEATFSAASTPKNRGGGGTLLTIWRADTKSHKFSS